MDLVSCCLFCSVNDAGWRRRTAFSQLQATHMRTLQRRLPQLLPPAQTCAHPHRWETLARLSQTSAKLLNTRLCSLNGEFVNIWRHLFLIAQVRGRSGAVSVTWASSRSTCCSGTKRSTAVRNVLHPLKNSIIQPDDFYFRRCYGDCGTSCILHALYDLPVLLF